MTIYNGERRNCAAARVSGRLRRDTLDHDASSTTGGIMNILARTLPLTVLLALSGAAQAVDGPGHTAGGPNRMAVRSMDPATLTQRMTTNLGLSPEQVTEVEQINQRFARQVEEHRKQQEAMRAAHQEAMGKIAAERDAELKKILNEEQYAKHASQQQRRRDHRGAGPGMAPPAPAQTAPPPAQ
jgi:hypothetical protein